MGVGDSAASGDVTSLLLGVWGCTLVPPPAPNTVPLPTLGHVEDFLSPLPSAPAMGFGGFGAGGALNDGRDLSSCGLGSAGGKLRQSWVYRGGCAQRASQLSRIYKGLGGHRQHPAPTPQQDLVCAGGLTKARGEGGALIQTCRGDGEKEGEEEEGERGGGAGSLPSTAGHGRARCSLPGCQRAGDTGGPARGGGQGLVGPQPPTHCCTAPCLLLGTSWAPPGHRSPAQPGGTAGFGWLPPAISAPPWAGRPLLRGTMTRLSWCFATLVRWGKYLVSCLLPCRACRHTEVSGATRARCPGSGWGPQGGHGAGEGSGGAWRWGGGGENWLWASRG